MNLKNYDCQFVQKQKMNAYLKELVVFLVIQYIVY